MAHYFKVTSETLAKMMDCFSDVQELTDFVTQYALVMGEVAKIYEQLETSENKEVDIPAALIKQVVMIVLFYRQNIELMQELMKKITYEHVEE